MPITYEFAFYAVYKRPMSKILIDNLPIITGKKYKDVLADVNIKEIWIDRLLNIKSISILSLFSGINRHFITHVIFSVNKLPNDKCIEIINKFNTKKYIKSNYDNFDITKSFFCLATRNWYRNEIQSKLLFEWWENIPYIIEEVINV